MCSVRLRLLLGSAEGARAEICKQEVGIKETGRHFVQLEYLTSTPQQKQNYIDLSGTVLSEKNKILQVIRKHGMHINLSMRDLDGKRTSHLC